MGALAIEALYADRRQLGKLTATEPRGELVSGAVGAWRGPEPLHRPGSTLSSVSAITFPSPTACGIVPHHLTRELIDPNPGGVGFSVPDARKNWSASSAVLSDTNISAGHLSNAWPPSSISTAGADNLPPSTAKSFRYGSPSKHCRTKPRPRWKLM
jgi:hypothetical protein